MTSLPVSRPSLRSRTTLAAGRLAPLLLLAVSLLGFHSAAPSAGAELPAKTAPAPEVRDEAAKSIRAPDADPKRPTQFAQLGVDAWHTAGYRGKGVKVAVLDSGFRGYRDQLGKALPDHVTVRSFRRDGNLEAKDSQHGILCGEVVHTLAPGAELLFANWEPDDPEQFLNAVRWARKEGARVITCSVIMPCWSDGEGGGPVHEALRQALGSGDAAGDPLLFASAGNIAQRHWSGTFRDGGDGFHEWRPKEKDNALSPWGEERVSVELCARPGSGYDLYVYERDTGEEVGRSLARDRKDKGTAVVRFHPASRHGYQVRVRLAEGKGGPFHLSSLSAGLAYSTAGGSVSFPGDGPEVIAVGAVDGDGRRMSYSSCGPNSSQPKPDLVAPVPFPSGFRSAPFAGTSAASPQAAAVAALCWSRHPDWSAGQVRAALRTAARDLGAPGHDCETGYGLVQVPPVSADKARELVPLR
jgi:subtilisin family serine protease